MPAPAATVAPRVYATPPPASLPPEGQAASFISLSTEFDSLVAPGTVAEVVADGLHWSEGPVWMAHGDYLLFSDVPENRIYKWSRKSGLSVYLQPSGYTGTGLSFQEPGSNGLTVDRGGHLVFCQHGNRRIARMDSHGKIEPVVDQFNWRRFNSPNDLVFDRRGNLYFTDPPYGHKGLNSSPLKELMFNGVYLYKASGETVLVDDQVTFPNGIALSPDEKKLYVNVSDADKPVILVYDIGADGSIGPSKVFFDTKPLTAGRQGLPDGLKVDVQGNLWTTGPGGMLVISPEGNLLGMINTGVPTGNCAWGEDGSTLFITANHRVLRMKTLTRGYGPWNDRLAAQQ
jgi:gluconolactonase